MAAEIMQVTELSPHHEGAAAPLVSAVTSVSPARPALPTEAVALPVLPALQELLPGGLPHGSVVAMGVWSLLCLALAAGASAAGAWCAVVGLPALGVAAAADTGIDPDRLLLIPEPGSGWPQVVASLLDGCELVLLRPPARPPASLRRRLESVARRHGGVLVIAGEWEGAQARLTIARQEWVGIGTGSGRLQARRAHVVAGGRGAAARPRDQWLWLPGPDGAIAPVAPAAGTTVTGTTATGTGAAEPRWRDRTAG
jgi:hypothetical protein